jgi:hypothetical protein
VKNRKLETFAAIGICSVALVLVIWIRGGFDPVPPHADTLLHVWEPAGTRGRIEFVPDVFGETTPERALTLMMMGKTGPYSLTGIMDPPIEEASAATVQDSAEVIGVSVKGHCRAYCISEMSTPFTHVINDVIQEVPVTVTFCKRTGCARVFTNTDELDRPLEVGVGGFADGQMVLHVADNNFAQNSQDIPLQELEFERTTWRAWKSACPDTDICTGLHKFSLGQKRPVAAVDRDSGSDISHAGE